MWEVRGFVLLWGVSLGISRAKYALSNAFESRTADTSVVASRPPTQFPAWVWFLPCPRLLISLTPPTLGAIAA